MRSSPGISAPPRRPEPMRSAEPSGALELGSSRALTAAGRGSLVDRLLAALLTVWGLGSLFPIAVWIGVSAPAVYDDQMAMRIWGVSIAGLITVLLLVLTRGRCARWV